MWMASELQVVGEQVSVKQVEMYIVLGGLGPVKKRAREPRDLVVDMHDLRRVVSRND